MFDEIAPGPTGKKFLALSNDHKNLKHKYWRYTSDLGTHLVVRRVCIKDIIVTDLNQVGGMSIREALIFLEQVENHKLWDFHDYECVIFNKLTICCILDSLLTDLLTGFYNPELRDKLISGIAFKVIARGAKNTIAKTPLEVDLYLEDNNDYKRMY